jgi:uncharacterized protein YbaA (DUF1428 family)
MTYVDGFVGAVPTANKEEYLKHATIGDQVLKDCGALKNVVCWGDDVPEGEVTSLPMSVKKQADETVIFGWFIWPDKETRDAGWKKAMEDPRMHPDNNPMPFDGRRSIIGGFEMLLES